MARPNFKKKRDLSTTTCVFHGQLYVAFSRVSKLENIKVKVDNYPQQGHLKGDHRVYTRNIVYKE